MTDLLRKKAPMNIVIIDDEVPAIEELKYYLKNYEVTIKNTYTNPTKALQNITIDQPDLVFLDMDMPYMHGIDLAEEIRKNLHNIIIVFVTAYAQYALDAYRVNPIDYVLKPIDSNVFQNTMERVLKQYQLICNHTDLPEEPKQNDQIKIKCFGKFEIVKNDTEVMKFKTKKTKELLAYLICNVDKVIYRDDMLHTLFQGSDGSKSLNNFYVTLHRLRNSLDEFGIDHNICHIDENNNIYIRENVCNYVDFYRFITNNRVVSDKNIEICQNIVDQYHGELFTDIDQLWADEIRVWVDIHIETLMLKMASFYEGGLKYSSTEQVLLHLIEINPMSTVAYEMLLDLYMKTEDWNSYRIQYEDYVRLMKDELKLDVNRKYFVYYKAKHDSCISHL